MLTLGFLALSVGLVPLAILFALGRVWTLEVASCASRGCP
jgi:hypothetical protein